VVPGASKGIGLAVVTAFVNEGVRVIAGSRNSSPELDALSKLGHVCFTNVDVSDPNGPARLRETVMRTTRSALPLMLAAGQGSIINISSISAFLPDPIIPDYCAAKAALSNFSKGLSKDATLVSRASGTSAESVRHGAIDRSATG